MDNKAQAFDALAHASENAAKCHEQDNCCDGYAVDDNTGAFLYPKGGQKSANGRDCVCQRNEVVY